MCAHRNQRRKYEDAPYVVHCECVARIVAEYTDDTNVIAAAVMHDVLEDTDRHGRGNVPGVRDTITDWC